MFAYLEIEAIGHNTEKDLRTLELCFGKYFAVPKRGTVTDVTYHDYPKEVFYKTDYSRSNSKGSRGVYKCYTLKHGKTYFVRKPTSWKSDDEFFCIVTQEGKIERFSSYEEVLKYKRSRSS